MHPGYLGGMVYVVCDCDKEMFPMNVLWKPIGDFGDSLHKEQMFNVACFIVFHSQVEGPGWIIAIFNDYISWWSRV